MHGGQEWDDCRQNLKTTINVPADLGTVMDTEAVNVNKSCRQKATMFERRIRLSPCPLDTITTPNQAAAMNQERRATR